MNSEKIGDQYILFGGLVFSGDEREEKLRVHDISERVEELQYVSIEQRPSENRNRLRRLSMQTKYTIRFNVSVNVTRF